MYTNDQAANDVRDDGTEQTTMDAPDAPGSTASGKATAGAPGSHPKPNRVVLESLTDRATVRIEVDGDVAPDCLVGVSDTIYRDDDVVVSRLVGTGERAAFRFSGTMADLEIVEGDVEVGMDLHRDDPTDRGRRTRLSIHAQGADVDYRFATSGTVETESGVDPRNGSEANTDLVTGTVAGSGVDEYLYTGEITAFETSTDEVLVMLDDQVVDPRILGRDRRS